MGKRKINLIEIIIIGIIIMLGILYAFLKIKNNNLQKATTISKTLNTTETLDITEVFNLTNEITTNINSNSMLNDTTNNINITSTPEEVVLNEEKIYEFDEVNFPNIDNNLVEFPMEEVRNVIEKVIAIEADWSKDGAVGILYELGYKSFEIERIEFKNIRNKPKELANIQDIIEVTDIKFDDFLSNILKYYNPNYFESTYYLNTFFSVNGNVAFFNGGMTGYDLEVGTIIKKDGISNDYYVEYQSKEIDDSYSIYKNYITINSYQGHPVVADRKNID